MANLCHIDSIKMKYTDFRRSKIVRALLIQKISAVALIAVFIVLPLSIHAKVGVVVVRPGNIQSIANQMSHETTIYVIKQQLDLCGKRLQIPKNSILKFKGGSVCNGEIVGNNTRISARIRQIFGDNLALSGSWNVQESYPEWFGAVGDGLTDDTWSIQRTMESALQCRVVFQRKTYIVNVVPGIDNDTQRIIFSGCRAPEMIGYGTVIRLGDNDNCNLYKYKGFGAMFSVYTLDSFFVKGITFDFNYETNPIYQTEGIRQGIQENTQQNAFQFRRVRKVTIDHCTFIGHSGTNCIDFNDARYNNGDKTFEVTIKNCKFLKCGGKSFFKDGEAIVDAYHDCSTIALHYTGNNHDTPYVVDVSNNYFEGVGGNAYNVLESDASDLTFTGNTIKRFSSCLFPLASVYNAKINVSGNCFYEVSRGIALWLRAGSDKDSDSYGFRQVRIIKNECNIDMEYWMSMPRYDNMGGIRANRYAFVLTTTGNNKSVGNLVIKDNIVRYINTKGADETVCAKACINFESVSDSVIMMRCDSLNIIGNKIYNAVNRIVHNSMFQEIGTFVFNDNYIENPFSVISASSLGSGGIIYLNASKAYAPSLTYPTLRKFVVENNTIEYDGYSSNDGCAVLVNSQMRAVKDYKGNELIVRNNRCSSTPQYGMFRFAALRELFGKVLVE